MSDGEIISVVDDDGAVRQALDGLLRSAGFRVAAFGSAEEFLESRELRTAACMILDVRLAGMGGLELQRRLARDGRPLPIIFVTAHGSEDVRARALTAGAVAVLEKPFDGDALLSAIDQCSGGNRVSPVGADTRRMS